MSLKDLVFKLLNDVNPDKAAGIDNLSGKFLKDGSSILARPISKIWQPFHKIFSLSDRLPNCQIKAIIQKRLHYSS